VRTSLLPCLLSEETAFQDDRRSLSSQARSTLAAGRTALLACVKAVSPRQPKIRILPGRPGAACRGIIKCDDQSWRTAVSVNTADAETRIAQDDAPSNRLAAVRAGISTWMKTTLGALAGVLSGAFMMYLSPLLDRVVKPARPVANFAVDHQGMTLSFVNHSSGGSEGWWDFGDGSPLEPVSFRQLAVTHTYAGPGTYVAKLTLRNLIGDQSERTVNVQLDSQQTDPPAILSLDAVPVSAGAYAPATFLVTAKTRNARLCVWDSGDDRNLEISADSPSSQERYVVFKKAGGYMVKLAAVNGEQAVQKSTIVYVDEPPPGSIAAIINVADEGTRVDKQETSVPVTAAFPPDCKDPVYSFDRQVPAQPGFEIISARLQTEHEEGVRNVEVKVAPDARSVHLTGELVRQTGMLHRNDPPANLLVRVVLVQERRLPARRPTVPVTATLNVPGAALLVLPPLPADWVEPQRQFRLELRDGDRVVWPESQLPRGGMVALQDRRFVLNATPLGNQVRVELAPEKVATASPPAVAGD
jgi:PKD repeat protein